MAKQKTAIAWKIVERAKIDTGHRIVMNEKDMKMLGRV